MSKSKWWCFAAETEGLESDHIMYCNASEEDNESIRQAFIERGHRVSDIQVLDFSIKTVH